MVIYVNLLSEFLVVRKSSCIYCLMLLVYNKQTKRQQTELIIDTGKVHLLDLVVSICYGQGCLKRFFPIEALLLGISRKLVIILTYAIYTFLGEISTIMDILASFR